LVLEDWQARPPGKTGRKLVLQVLIKGGEKKRGATLNAKTIEDHVRKTPTGQAWLRSGWKKKRGCGGRNKHGPAYGRRCGKKTAKKKKTVETNGERTFVH